ncbi:thiamine phosphate synthase [Dasania sp. GY-MA-18]|uniref:Thiamine-phosphate synthase n=1 Tax=Dasania phycosphaerae TaxID=2950436 RepID=A0A9J6RPV3_9GAMM|nr:MULTISPECIES: thiamine phosphate synthase [Dasania]MCR8924022.1 thiamine phosphate synthase [Dasania sp. GY-MA-18]MCZ0866595.1 thiamine phosphate synthase [Dasania phycosphaerae]MCZ0870180.1 thiamine phosphate synthase [Dasania phycosphaerae]
MSKVFRRVSVCCFSASDSSAHAGMQADLRTLSDLAVHGCSVVTAITAQNSQRLLQCSASDQASLIAQWQSVAQDLKPVACKVGLLANSDQVKTLATIAGQYSAVWIADPVLQSSTGHNFHSPDFIAAYKQLLPQLDLITPNIPEAAALTGQPINSAEDVICAAKQLQRQGVGAVLIKGGHAIGGGTRSQDYFYSPDKQFWLSSPRQAAANNRGTGCVMASAIAAFISLGKSMADAVVLAYAYVQQGLRAGYAVGQGAGPVLNGGWPKALSDYPEVSEQADYVSPSPFASCDTDSLGLYPVIDSIDWLKKLLAAGVSTIQLRIKNLQGQALSETLNLAIQLGREYKARLFINDHWQLALQLKAYGVHLGQEDIGSADINALRAAGIRLGVSTHSEYEWARAHALRPSYIALGAVFATQTKPAQVIGLDNLQCWAPLLQQRYPVTAIGGINASNIAAVLASGVRSVAVVTAITQAACYRQATQQLLQQMAQA